jgi:membrane associated rhomboid family serine protease
MRTPDSWHTAQATVAIALVTALLYLIVSMMGWSYEALLWGAFFPPSEQLFALIDQELGFPRAPFFLTPLTAALLHAGIVHLLFNMLIFAFCGRAVEGALGPVNLVILYVAGAYAAAAGQYGADQLLGAMPRPMVGASGAVSAVIGAYSMLFGKNRVRVANSKLALWLNVLWLLVAWVVLQVAVAIVVSESTDAGLLLAVGAHVGGFVAGVALARPLLLWRYRKA